MFQVQKRTIIAMKGHPFTRKTYFVGLIAEQLRCSVLSLNAILRVLSPESCRPQQPQDVAFRILCKIVKSNLLATQEFVNHIIIDSPLSSRSHLDQLIELAKDCRNSRLVIVECKTDNTYRWQTEFETYVPGDRSRDSKWYKAKTWEDVEKAIREGFDERSLGYQLPKLVLDPLLDDQNAANSPHFREALDYLMRLKEGHGPDLVVYQRWLHGVYIPYCISTADGQKRCDSTRSRCCSGGSSHFITNFAKQGLQDEESKCGACENLLHMDEPAYTCQLCIFALHKECAELLDDYNQPSRVYKDKLRTSVMGYGQHLFSKRKFWCGSCEEEEEKENERRSSVKFFVSSCWDCLFTTHLKSRVVPTVIRHDCHEHFLSIVLAHSSGGYFQCKACGHSIESICYSCKLCGIAYCYECLTEVRAQVKHEHGMHHHHMALQYSSQQAEDYICDVCFERELPHDRRDPNLWFYSCEDCLYVAHLYCGQLRKTEY